MTVPVNGLAGAGSGLAGGLVGVLLGVALALTATDDGLLEVTECVGWLELGRAEGGETDAEVLVTDADPGEVGSAVLGCGAAVQPATSRAAIAENNPNTTRMNIKTARGAG